MSTAASKIDTFSFYSQFKGHPIRDLTTFNDITLTERPDKPVIYLAGDSSLDNKYWVESSARVDGKPVQVPEIYSKMFNYATPKPDVAFWMNHLLGDRATCVNTAVEASMLKQREGGLLNHDEFIRDNIRSEDILIVSVGANDVVLSPSASTIRHLLQLVWLTSQSSIENNTASSLNHFKHLFGHLTQEYIARLTAKTKPRAVIVCMIYYPLEAGLGQASWADASLKALSYTSNPGKLQAAIRTMYEHATKEIRIEGTEVVPCAVYEVLDGKQPADYTERVEPNSEGGRKMATKFVDLLEILWKTASEEQSLRDNL